MLGRVFARLSHGHERGPAWRVLGLGVLAAVAAWYFGADAWHAILFGTVIAIAIVAVTLAGELEEGGARWRGGDRLVREGSRNDVVSLSWLMRGSWGRVDARAVSRLRSVARTRLQPYGLALGEEGDRAAIERLIGRRPYLVLAAGRRPPRLGTLLACMDALDALARRDSLDPVTTEERR